MLMDRDSSNLSEVVSELGKRSLEAYEDDLAQTWPSYERDNIQIAHAASSEVTMSQEVNIN